MKKDDFVNLVREAIHQLQEQGEVCRTDDGRCAYLNEKNQSCIVGLMMPDTDTRNHAVLADGGVYSLVGHTEFTWTDQFNKPQLGLMRRLQNIHDDRPDAFNEKIASMQLKLHDYMGISWE